MLTGILMLLGTGLAWAFVGVIVSLTAKARYNMVTVFTMQSLMSLVVSLIIFPDYGGLAANGNSDLWMLAAVMLAAGLTGSIGILTLQRAMRAGHHGISWSVGQSALIVPFLAAVIFFDEPAPLLRLCGVLAILGSLIILGMARQNEPVKETDGAVKSSLCFVLALLALVIFGVQQTLTTVPSHLATMTDTMNLRIPLMYIGGGVVFVFLWLRKPVRPERREVVLALIATAIGITSYFLLFLGLDSLAVARATSIGYPVATGTCIIGFVAYSFLVMREACTPWHIAGMGLGITGIVFVSL